MKKFLLKFAMVMAVLGAAILISCEEIAPVQSACERDGTGTVKVINKTGYSIWVDCTYSSNGTNYEKKLYNGGSYTYTMDKGSIYIWASLDDRDSWTRNSYYLAECENMTYTWTYDMKKSTGPPIYCIITDGDGNILNPTEDLVVVNKYE